MSTSEFGKMTSKSAKIHACFWKRSRLEVAHLWTYFLFEENAFCHVLSERKLMFSERSQDYYILGEKRENKFFFVERVFLTD